MASDTRSGVLQTTFPGSNPTACRETAHHEGRPSAQPMPDVADNDWGLPVVATANGPEYVDDRALSHPIPFLVEGTQAACDSLLLTVETWTFV